MAEQPKVNKGTVHPFPNFNVAADVEALKTAMKGLGTDEKAIIDILCNRSVTQRIEIRNAFKITYGKDLISSLKSELSGHFEDTILALLLDPLEYEAKCLRDAMKGLGTNEKVLTEIICTKSNKEIRELKELYEKLYKTDLEKAVVSETSGFYKRVLVACLQAQRGEVTPEQLHKSQTLGLEAAIDRTLAKQEAEELVKAGIKQWGTDESAFIRILLNRDPLQLQATIDEYEKLAGETLFTSIKKEMSGDLKDAMEAAVLSKLSQPLYYAKLLHSSMKGLGTRDHTLIRVIVTRSEIDLEEIKQLFFQETGKTLSSYIEGDTSGDYKRALLAIVK